ncbi:MAG: acyl-CoA thioesterase [Leptolyngbyaceae cyanobacterium SL_1_1]|nr:acyl-CoA thioesterase [Leptolyngbyaceae cyanobacterium RM1_1_2]NJO09573.1 acyl-CoA thioesterase [Leptolyngbyaceae cyanobacterium SL_1_1]
MPFSYWRTIRFVETDAAGVVYFANLLSLCHEAYEAALAEADINLKIFFGRGAIAVPIVYAQADFYQPLFCGDRIVIRLTPQRLDVSRFAITYEIWPDQSEAQSKGDRPLATAITHHVCIDTASRRRQLLTAELHHWLTQFSAPQDK